MLGLHAFPALRRLFVAQQALSRLQGLEACPQLEARPAATQRATPGLSFGLTLLPQTADLVGV